MALARIISLSQQCSRELALDLLARGYTVEIVSPDAIPDNLADLELRVDADSGTELTATVAARDATHCASLDFVHHLKAPLGDFVRRTPETSQPVYFPAQPVSFNAEQGSFDEVELPRNAPDLAPANQVRKFLPSSEEAGPLIIPPPEQVRPPAKESDDHVRSGITIIFHRSRSKSKLTLKPANASGGWFLSASTGVAAIVLLAVVLGMGLRRDGGKSISQNSASQNSAMGNPKTALAEEANVLAVREPQRPPDMAAVRNGISGPQEKHAEVSATASSPKSPSIPSKPRIESSLRKANDLSTSNAAIYRDKPVAQVAKNNSARSQKSRRGHHEDLVAADTVTYLDRTIAPKGHPR